MRGRKSSTPDPFTGFEQLRATLAEAVKRMEEITSDPVLRRVIDAFAAMPAADREIVAGVIEREVQGRLLNRATGPVTGQETWVNPNARLYVRTHTPEVPRGPLEEEEMMLGTIRMLRAARFLAVPDIHAEWRRATRAALDHVDDETLAVFERLLHDALAMLTDRRWAGTER